jgi:hypothetical protein
MSVPVKAFQTVAEQEFVAKHLLLAVEDGLASYKAERLDIIPAVERTWRSSGVFHLLTIGTRTGKLECPRHRAWEDNIGQK